MYTLLLISASIVILVLVGLLILALQDIKMLGEHIEKLNHNHRKLFAAWQRLQNRGKK